MAQSFEKRANDRMATNGFSIQYRFCTDNFLTPAAVINISGSGICFIRTSPVAKNDIIEILFPFKSREIILKARIVRVDGREVGIKFEDNQDKIDGFVDLFNREYKIIRDDSKKSEEKKKSLFSRDDDNIDDILSDV